MLVPAGYRSRPARRYPVLYLLHGAGADQTTWTNEGQGEAEALTAGLPLIVVMPSAGRGGFYTDWFNNGAGGKPRWESWHIKRLIPYVDDHYRTRATRGKRAIAGLSMGGFGTFTYASRHPDLFTAALSLSGAVDTGIPPCRPGIIDSISALRRRTAGLAVGPAGHPGGALAGPQPDRPGREPAWVEALAAHRQRPPRRPLRRWRQHRHHRARRRRPGVHAPPPPAGAPDTPRVRGLRPRPPPVALLESRPASDAPGDHGSLEAAGAPARPRHVHCGRAALRRVRLDRAREAAGDGVQPVGQGESARLQAVRQRHREGDHGAPVHPARALPGSHHQRHRLRSEPAAPGRRPRAPAHSGAARPRQPAAAVHARRNDARVHERVRIAAR